MKNSGVDGLNLRLKEGRYQLLPTPISTGEADDVKIIRFSTSVPFPTLRGWVDEAKIV